MTNKINNSSVDRERIRGQFPALRDPDVFLDNAGGSQVPAIVADRVRDYMIGSYVQLGADYRAAKRATQTVDRARNFVKLLMNGDGLGEVILGPSTSALCAMLADCYARAKETKRDEIVVCEAGHEANVSPWMKLGSLGYKVKMWHADPETGKCSIEELKKLLTERTRILAVPHVSNILGEVEDIKEQARLAHEVGARIVVDAVAYAPHRAMDMAACGADWYVFSLYKVYGPHMSALFGTREALAELEGPGFFFIDKNDVPYKMELGGVLHEGCAGILGVRDYIGFLAGSPPGAEVDRKAVEQAFFEMAELEKPLIAKLLDYLGSKKKLRLIGPAIADATRVGTISFAHREKPSKQIVLTANDQGLGIRYGHFYAHRLLSALKLDPEDGVVRTSLVHYNSLEEIDRLIRCFESIL